jgi:DNA polymerase
LGLTEFYRRPVDPALMAQIATEPFATPQPDPIPVTSQEPIQNPGAPGLASETWEASAQEEQPIPPRKTFSAPPQIAAAVPPEEREAALRILREEIGDCTRCALHTGRHKLVFGDGDAAARLMFVGEGPGADEDAPGNRTPEPDEANTCSPFLFRQIDIVRPEVLVALGATAATYLLGQRQPLAGLRGRVHSYRGAKLIVTYHPAYLLRDPRQKKEAWADLQIAMRELGLKAPGRG